MKKALTDTEKVAALTGAITRADRELNLILEPMDHRTSERLLTVCRRVRKILRRALKKVCGAQAAAGASTCTEEVGTLREPTDGCLVSATQSGAAGASTCTNAVRGSARGHTARADHEDQPEKACRATGGSIRKGGIHGKA